MKPTAWDIHHDEAPGNAREIANGRQIGDIAVHGKNTVCCDHRRGRLRVSGAHLEVFHIVVQVAEALRFAETDAVDDAGMIQFIRDDGVLSPSKVSKSPPLASKQEL